MSSMLSLIHVNANVCVCVCAHPSCTRPVWRSGTATAWRWWTTCRKPSFCACRHWKCTEPLTLTSASLARLVETDNPRQVTHTHTHTPFLNPFTIHTMQLHYTVLFCPLKLFSFLLFLLSPSVGSSFQDSTDPSGEPDALHF